jgi:hypothetical protein
MTTCTQSHEGKIFQKRGDEWAVGGWTRASHDGRYLMPRVFLGRRPSRGSCRKTFKLIEAAFSLMRSMPSGAVSELRDLPKMPSVAGALRMAYR